MAGEKKKTTRSTKKKDEKVSMTLNQLFKLSDLEDSGFIPEDRITNVMHSAGYAVTRAQLEPYLENYREITNGKITFSQFKELCSIFTPDPKRSDSIRECFTDLNYDPSENINAQDFKKYLMSNGIKLGAGVIDDFFKHLKIKDGRISVEDMVSKLASTSVLI